MAKHERIDQLVLKLKNETTLNNGLTFPAGTEFEIVIDVVYMKGFPLPPAMQNEMYNWLVGNPQLFIDDTRRF